MADVRSVLDHLLDGRAVLVAEVDRLAAAVRDLDAVIGRLGGAGAAPAPVSPVAPPPVTEPVTTWGAPLAARTAPVRKAPARKPPAKAAPTVAEGGKSIRVHVLEMLESEQRDMGLAEIIDRVHAAGIRAHDDAVRSITIKLMKDGKVERVGRGQYRLASRSAGPAGVGSEGLDPAAAESDAAPADPSVTGDGSGRPDDSPAGDRPGAIELEPTGDGSTNGSTDTRPTGVVPTGAHPGGLTGGEATDTAGTAQEGEGLRQSSGIQSPTSRDAGYTPPLNLGQPWQQR